MRNEKGQFVKGHPGNKNAPGRPPVARSLSEAIRSRGHEIYNPKTGETRYDALAVGLWDIALTHEDADVRLRATKEIADRTEGRPAQKVEVSTDESVLIKSYPQELVEKVS